MSDPAVDADEVRHVAELARIELDDREIERFREEFVEILEYFDRLEEVPDVDAKDELENVLRADKVTPSLPQEEAMRNADEREDGYFKGPPVG